MVVLPVTAATIINTVAGLFQGSSYDATHKKILSWVAQIQGNPAAAKSPGTPEYKAYVGLRCWAGDNATAHLNEYVQLWGDASALTQGCGCETSHGCRADAQTALAEVDQLLSVTIGGLSSDPIPSGNTSGSGGPSVQVNIPVPNSTVLGATVGGVNVWVVLILAALGIYALAKFSRRR